MSNAQTQFQFSFLQLCKNFASKMMLTCLFLCVYLQNLLLSPKNVLEMMRNHRKILTFEETRVFVVVHTKRQSNQTCSLNVSFSMPKIMNFAYILLRLKCSPTTNLGHRKKGCRACLYFTRVLVSWLYRSERAAAFASHCSFSHLLLRPDTESHS